MSGRTPAPIRVSSWLALVAGREETLWAAVCTACKPYPIAVDLYYRSPSEAAEAGRAHLREVHMPQVIADALDALDASDPETAHGAADVLLLEAAPPVVQEAYRRVITRTRWWAYS